MFIKKELLGAKKILEIGAGYGRSANTILSLFDNVKEYTIVDLPDMLNLSRKYLREVCSFKNYKKLNFIEFNKFSYEDKFDMAINIDSMQEMTEPSVKRYLNYIDSYCDSFYCKNTIAKFDPNLFGWDLNKSVRLALNSVVLTQKINIFCENEILCARNRFLEVFSPSKGWDIRKQGETYPWSHYYQALFVKNVFN